MSFDDDQLILIVTRVASAVALLVALLFPLGYFIVGYADLAATLQTRAEIKADEITQLITKAPQAWTFEEHRLKEALTRHAIDSTDRAAIVDPRGELLLTMGEPASAPALTRSHPLYESGQVVGHIRIEQSLRPVIAKTALAALLGLLLGGAVFFALKVLPLRALRRVTDALVREKERAEITLRSIGDAVITTDAAESVEFLNPAAARLTGWSLGEAKGRPLGEVLHMVNEISGKPIENLLHRAMVRNSAIAVERDAALVQRDGSMVAIENSAAPIRNDEGKATGGVLVIRDVSVARDLTHQLTWQASHDVLTGLFNRREFESRVDAALTSARSSAKHHAVCYLDLDQFKIVNDTSGHLAGDELLKQIAALLQSKIRESDTLARLGGDEFGLLLDGCPLDRAELIAADLLSAVRDYRFNWEDKMFNVGVSIGLVPIHADSSTRVEVLSAADTACYLAKEQGRNRVSVFRGAAGDVAERRNQMGWIGRIQEAMREDRLRLFYQSYLTLAADSPVKHIEVLLRMVDEEGNIVSPGSFLPAAERYNLMPEIDRWVIRTVFRQFPAIESRLGCPRIVCAINISGTSINSEGFLDFIRAQVRKYGISPDSICFELTESAAINNLRKAAEFMKEGRALGFHFALDDFGTGTSSFGYLKNLPVDYLKIDGGFVKDIMTDPIDRAMTETINRIGHIMGLKTVAEFAESEAIIGQLKTIGVDFIQGYAVSKPAPLFPAADAPASLKSAGINETLAQERKFPKPQASIRLLER